MVIWSQQAVADLRSIHDFITRDSHYYAKKVVHDIREKIEELNMIDNELEIVLKDLELDDLAEDWYVNLQKSSKRCGILLTVVFIDNDARELLDF